MDHAAKNSARRSHVSYTPRPSRKEMTVLKRLEGCKIVSGSL
jgi:hypothetical protein